MNLLFVLSNWTYPGKEGLHIQTAAWLAEVVRMGVRVRLVVFARDVASVDVAAIESSWKGSVSVVVHHLTDSYPVLLFKNIVRPVWLNPVFGHVERELASCRYDVIHLEGIGLSPLIPSLSKFSPVIMSTVDAWSLRQVRLSRQAIGIKRMALLAYHFVSKFAERRYFSKAAAVHVVSTDDADYLGRVQGLGNVVTIPVGLLRIPPLVRNLPRTEPLVFWGDIGVHYLRSGLVWLKSEVMTRLPDQPALLVIGRRLPDEQLVNLCGGNVRFLTWVDDFDSCIQQADIVVLPDQSGSGMKNRTLSAMACGVPVVGTRFAFEGFDVQDGYHCFVRNTPDDFSDAIKSLMNDEDLRRDVGARGRKFVIDRYGIQSVAYSWFRLYQSKSRLE